MMLILMLTMMVIMMTVLGNHENEGDGHDLDGDVVENDIE